MSDFSISKHAKEQMELRGISEEVILKILNGAQQVITQEGKRIYQSIINFEDGIYLVRIFVNIEKEPFIVITVYRTSKIDKYYEG